MTSNFAVVHVIANNYIDFKAYLNLKEWKNTFDLNDSRVILTQHRISFTLDSCYLKDKIWLNLFTFPTH